LASSLFFSLMYAVFWTTVGGRFVWAMAQPELLVLEDGSLIIEGDSQELSENDRAIARSIPIGILPEWLGTTWQRTGTPIGGVLFITVFTLAECTFITFETTCVLSLYNYFCMHFLVNVAFMVMRYYEPDAHRSYRIPYGKAGAWILSVGTGLAMGAVGLYMAVTIYWEAACVWIGCNAVFVIYYFTIKKIIDRRAEEDNEQMQPLLNGADDNVAVDEEVDANEEVVA